MPPRSGLHSPSVSYVLNEYILLTFFQSHTTRYRDSREKRPTIAFELAAMLA